MIQPFFLSNLQWVLTRWEGTSPPPDLTPSRSYKKKAPPVIYIPLNRGGHLLQMFAPWGPDWWRDRPSYWIGCTTVSLGAKPSFWVRLRVFVYMTASKQKDQLQYSFDFGPGSLQKSYCYSFYSQLQHISFRAQTCMWRGVPKFRLNSIFAPDNHSTLSSNKPRDAR
jgi:hypothetical protein